MTSGQHRGKPDVLGLTDDSSANRTRRRLRRRLRRLRRRLKHRVRRAWRWTRKRAWWGVMALAVLTIYGGWLAGRAEQSLTNVDSDAQLVSSALSSGNDTQLHAAFAQLRADAAASDSRTSGPGWWVLSHLPVIGEDARGVRTLAVVSAHLSSGSVEQLAARSAELRQVLPTHGQVDLAAVHSLAATIAPGRRSVDLAQERLATESPGRMLPPLRSVYTRLRDRVDQLAGVLRAADLSARVMPEMLGASGGTKHYLLVLQNNAEIRATGGLPGAISEIVVHRGHLVVGRQTSGADFLPTNQPILPLSSTEQALYGVQLGRWFLDANFTPDFPRTAELMRAHWEQVYGGHVDGVISVDPVALSYLLAATGPVTVDGVTLTSDNVVDQLLHETYVRLDGAGQDAFFRAVTKDVFDRFVAGGTDPAHVAAALSRGIAEHRVLLHDFTPTVQDDIATTELAGQLLKNTPGHPQVGLFFNDSTGAKMSYYLRYQSAVGASSCTGGRQQLQGTLTVWSEAPANAASMPIWVTGGGVYGVPPGDQVVTLRVFGPVGGRIGTVTLDGADAVQQETFELDGRPVTKLWISLAPGQSHKVGWTATSAPGETGSSYVAMTPSVQPGRSSVTIPSVCG